MRPTKATIFIVFMMFCMAAAAQDQYSTVKIYGPRDKTQRAELLGLLQIDHFYNKDGAIIAEINQDDIAKLRTTPYRFEIVVPDVAHYVDSVNQKYYASLNDPNSRVALEYTGGSLSSLIAQPAAFTVWGTFGGYYNFAQMNTAMGQPSSLGGDQKAAPDRGPWLAKRLASEAVLE